MKRRSAVVFAGYALLLLTLSLYPFQFGSRQPFLPWETVQTNREIADVAANLWIYALLGALAIVTFGRNWSGFLRATAFGIALSCTVEFIQQWIPGRFSSGTDLAANSLGTALGAAALWLTANKRTDAARSVPSLSRDGALLLALWMFWQGYPFFPLVRTSKMMDAYHRLRDSWWGAGSWADVSQVFTGFLILAVAVKSPFWRAVAFSILFIQGVLREHSLKPVSTIAAAIAWIIVTAAVRWPNFSRAARLAPVAILAWLAAEELRPFQFSSQAQPFSVLPFENILDSGSESSYLPVLAKLFLYTAALWTLERSGWSLRRSLCATGMVLLAGEWAQRWIPSRTPELTTDLLLLGAGGVLLWWTRFHSPVPSAQESNLKESAHH